MQGKRQNPYYQAQAILSRRDHSEAEVRTKLKKKGFLAADVDATIAWLQERGLLDDRKFAAAYVESVLRTKAVGPRWLQAKLREKGIAAPLLEEAMEQAWAKQSEEEFLAAAAQRWQRQHLRYKDDRVRLSRFLSSRGFSPDKIQNFFSGSRNS